MEGYVLSSLAPPTPQISFPIEHGQQEVQPRIALGRAWSNPSEDISQIDTLARSYGTNQRMQSHQEAQTPGGEGNQDKCQTDSMIKV
ncbi:hypothetical protein O181_061714 [Austropuccinia psidii MF-1]|uniref:Uncharacterized protein n=1 Tax=Austropuccinia psidii MF-1 TaxID=1389203 RepID=A0A9Q3EIR1_9BASI|nr:hypothetical protein [Austropuccinia psidii MF-1]